MTTKNGGLIGTNLPRKEDDRLLRGAGRFVDDCDDPKMLHVAIARCPFPHARIVSIRVEAALSLPGVAAVITGEEVQRRTEPITVLRPFPGLLPHRYYGMARDVARFEGEPVAAVAARDRYVAEDALELLEIEYEPLPHVVDAEAGARPDAPVLHAELGTNVLADNEVNKLDADGMIARASVVESDRFQLGRVLGLAIETRGVVARYDRSSRSLDIVSSTQTPHLTRSQLATALRMSEGLIRIRAEAVGGSFGNKLGLYPEEIIMSLLAIDTGRAVKWIEDRIEHFRSCVHGREATHRIDLAADKQGRLLALRDDYFIDIGAYNGPWGPSVLAGVTLPGPYNIENFKTRRRIVTTNKVPMGAYRGYGPPESNFVREVLLDRIARRLRMDPAEIRRRNFVQPEQMPFTTASGAIYDSGRYERCLDLALEKLGYPKVREEQARARKEGRLMGIGLSCYVEHAGYGAAYVSRSLGRRFGSYESATVRMDMSGHATVSTGIPNFGQGVETAYTQICAEALGLDPGCVSVRTGDTLGTPHSVGAMGSRGTLTGGGAIVDATRQLRVKLLRFAARQAGAPLESMDMKGGIITSLAVPGLRIPVAEIANWILLGQELPPGEEPGLEATSYWQQPAPSFGFGTVAVVVEVDRATGEFEIKRYLIAHDCGTILNPMLVEGQVAGGIVQGLGATLMEGLVYDKDTGQLVNGSMVDYLVPTAADLPPFEMAHLETPSPYTPYGLKGVGESGVIGAAAAVANALSDALSAYGVGFNQIPITPEMVWQAIEKATATRDAIPAGTEHMAEEHVA